MYKQTILGPLWILLSPLLTAGIFTVVFGRIAGVSTDGVPDYLFYMGGSVLWTYFSSCLLSASNTFTGNAGLFGKVYFPRLIMPVSAAISKLIIFFVQFFLFLVLTLRLLPSGDVRINCWCLATPFLLLQLAFLAMGMGLILASMTAKYRDLQVLVSFGVQLWMYATPIVYPLSEIPDSWRWIALCNPVAPTVECFRYGWLGKGSVSLVHLTFAAGVTMIIFLLGLLLFNHTQRNFTDTI